jgi:hypothetical protein
LIFFGIHLNQRMYPDGLNDQTVPDSASQFFGFWFLESMETPKK